MPVRIVNTVTIAQRMEEHAGCVKDEKVIVSALDKLRSA